MKRTSRKRASRRKPRAMTAQQAVHAICRAPLHVLVWLLAEPIVWIPLGALLLTRFGLVPHGPFASP